MPQPDLVHELPDGRRLGYTLYGDPAGAAVVTLHGTPGSRHKFAVADAEARRLGLCLISPDRWGYGSSDAPPGRVRLADYARDVASLLDELAVDRCGAVGVSGGGPYAAALASVLGARIGALALVAPVAPVDSQDRLQGVKVFHRFAFRVLPRLPGAVGLAFACFRGALGVSPTVAMRMMAARAGRADRLLLAEPDISADLVKTFRAGMTRGVRGPRIDMELFCRDWQLDLANVSGSSRMWLGRQDRNVPLAAARKLAGDVAGLELIEIEDAGHFWITRHFGQVLCWLAEKLRDDHRPWEWPKTEAAGTLVPAAAKQVK